MGNSKKRYALVQCMVCHHKTRTIYPEKGESDFELAVRAIAVWEKEMADARSVTA